MRKLQEIKFLPAVEIKGYNVMIERRNFFDQLEKSYLRTYDNIQKVPIVEGDDYTTCCLLGYPYFKKCYKLIAIELSKQQKLDDDPIPIQQINFTESLDRNGNAQMFFIIEKTKEIVLEQP